MVQGAPDSGDAAVPFDDRGFAYGDGVFETILVREGKPLLWAQHESRLREGCSRLGIPQPSTTDLMAAFSRVAELQVTKLVVTRGSGGRGYAPPSQPVPRLRWHSSPFFPQYTRFNTPNRARLCRLRLSHQPLLAGIKHMNRLENVVARREWSGDDYVEGLMCDAAGHVVDGTAMNIGWHDGKRWLTPVLEGCGVAGTLRARLVSEGLMAGSVLTLDDMSCIEALCVFNSVQGVWPIARLDSPDGDLLWQGSLTQVESLAAPAHDWLGYAQPD